MSTTLSKTTKKCAGYKYDDKNTGIRCPNLLPITSEFEFCGNHGDANHEHHDYHETCDKLKRCSYFDSSNRDVQKKSPKMLEQIKTEYQNQKLEANKCGDQREEFMIRRVHPDAWTDGHKEAIAWARRIVDFCKLQITSVSIEINRKKEEESKYQNDIAEEERKIHEDSLRLQQLNQQQIDNDEKEREDKEKALSQLHDVSEPIASSTSSVTTKKKLKDISFMSLEELSNELDKMGIKATGLMISKLAMLETHLVECSSKAVKNLKFKNEVDSLHLLNDFHRSFWILLWNIFIETLAMSFKEQRSKPSDQEITAFELNLTELSRGAWASFIGNIETSDKNYQQKEYLEKFRGMTHKLINQIQIPKGFLDDMELFWSLPMATVCSYGAMRNTNELIRISIVVRGAFDRKSFANRLYLRQQENSNFFNNFLVIPPEDSPDNMPGQYAFTQAFNSRQTRSQLSQNLIKTTQTKSNIQGSSESSEILKDSIWKTGPRGGVYFIHRNSGRKIYKKKN